MVEENKADLQVLVIGVDNPLGYAVASRCLSEGARVIIHAATFVESYYQYVKLSKAYPDSCIEYTYANLKLRSEIKLMTSRIKIKIARLDAVLFSHYTKHPKEYYWCNHEQHYWINNYVPKMIAGELIGLLNASKVGVLATPTGAKWYRDSLGDISDNDPKSARYAFKLSMQRAGKMGCEWANWMGSEKNKVKVVCIDIKPSLRPSQKVTKKLYRSNIYRFIDIIYTYIDNHLNRLCACAYWHTLVGKVENGAILKQKGLLGLSMQVMSE